MPGLWKSRNLHNNAVASPREREVEKANAEATTATEAYAKAHHDGASPEDLRQAAKNMQRALKHQDALTGKYRHRGKPQE